MLRAGRRQRWRRHHSAYVSRVPYPTDGSDLRTYGPMSFDLTQSLIYNPAFVTMQGGGLPQAGATLVAEIIGGLTYFNIHTVGFPSGEIRGQVVPLPAALPLFAAGLGIVTFLARRKKTTAARPM